jgi:hypothetical protein
MSALPSVPRPSLREGDERHRVEELVQRIGEHRAADGALLLLARALSSRGHPRATDTWRRLLEEYPPRSVQAEAAEWLAREAFGAGQPRAGLRMLHAASVLGRPVDPDAFRGTYKQSNLDPVAAFSRYLVVARLDRATARAAGVRDPLTEQMWANQDPRWWRIEPARHALANSVQRSQPETDHQTEALNRARDLAQSKRDIGWVFLAEGDYVAGPRGVRTIARNARSGDAEAADHNAFVRIRLAYEGAADRLPDVAWPWYRLAELLAWAGFGERAQEHLAQAERRCLGNREAERVQRPLLRSLIQAALGTTVDGAIKAPRPFPIEPFGIPLAWRLRLR